MSFADGTSQTSDPLEFILAKPSGWLTGRASARLTLQPEIIVPGQETVMTYELAVKPVRGYDLRLDGMSIAPPNEAIIISETDGESGSLLDEDNQQWSTFTKQWRFTMPQQGVWGIRGQQQVLAIRGGFIPQPQQYATAIPEPVYLEVVAMPAAGQPADFSGLIAPLQMALSSERDQVRVGEGMKVQVTVTTNQIDLLDWPEWPNVPGIRLRQLDSERDDQTKTFYWNLEPLQAGTITLPPLSLPFFNPRSQTYDRMQSNSLTIEALPGRQRNLTIVGVPLVVMSTLRIRTPPVQMA